MSDFRDIVSVLRIDQDTKLRIIAILKEADEKAEPEKPLREAVLLIDEAMPSLTKFDALREIYRIFKKGCSERHRNFSFTPEHSIELPQDLPPCPEPDPRYHFSYPPEDRGYRKDIDMLEELAKIRDEELPDGAILPIIKCFSPSFRRFEDCGSGENMFPDRILQRYGARVFPCIMRVLAEPERYTLEPHNVYQTHLILLRVATKLPEELMLHVFRAVFKSGWNKRFGSYINSLVPNGRIKANLVREFSDSPYGDLNLFEACFVDFDKDTLKISSRGEETLVQVADSFACYPSWVKLSLVGYDSSNELIASGHTRVVSELLVTKYKVNPERIKIEWEVLADSNASVLVGIWPDKSIPH